MIQVRNVNKYFSNLRVLHQVSLEIKKGDIFGIIGQSGAGKSTLLRCMNGLETYQEGSITIDGKDIKTLNKRQLQQMQKKMGMIFQNFNLLNRLNVYDNIALPLQFWKENKNSEKNKKKIFDLLKLVGLEDKINSYPSQLSGGQKQRVAIARALILDPEILLCDEATSALDPKITKDILTLLSKINKELNITIVIVTHQMEVIKEICNQVSFIKDGKIIANGRPEQLFVAPNKEIQAFVGDHVEFLPKVGINIKLFFNDKNSESYLITQLARTLNIDFSICQGKLENYRGLIMGSLIINIKESDCPLVTNYLDNRHILWEEV